MWRRQRWRRRRRQWQALVLKAVASSGGSELAAAARVPSIPRRVARRGAAWRGAAWRGAAWRGVAYYTSFHKVPWRGFGLGHRLKERVAVWCGRRA